MATESSFDKHVMFHFGANYSTEANIGTNGISGFNYRLYQIYPLFGSDNLGYEYSFMLMGFGSKYSGSLGGPGSEQQRTLINFVLNLGLNYPLLKTLDIHGGPYIGVPLVTKLDVEGPNDSGDIKIEDETYLGDYGLYLGGNFFLTDRITLTGEVYYGLADTPSFDGLTGGRNRAALIGISFDMYRNKPK